MTPAPTPARPWSCSRDLPARSGREEMPAPDEGPRGTVLEPPRQPIPDLRVGLLDRQRTAEEPLTHLERPGADPLNSEEVLPGHLPQRGEGRSILRQVLGRGEVEAELPPLGPGERTVEGENLLYSSSDG